MMNNLKLIPFTIIIITGCSTMQDPVIPDPVYVESESANTSVFFIGRPHDFGYKKAYLKEFFQHIFATENYSLWLYEEPELCNDSKKVDLKKLDYGKLMIPTSSYATMKIVKKFSRPGNSSMICENIFSFKVNEKSNYLIDHEFTSHGCTVTLFDDTTNEKLKLFERKQCSIDELESSKLTDISKSSLSFSPIVWYY